MERFIVVFILLMSTSARAHIPVLLLPLKGTPISSYFIGQSDVSHALYSELTQSDDFFVAQFYVKDQTQTLIQVLTPTCTSLPQYEGYQPSALVIQGEPPWKKQGETNRQYIRHLESLAVVHIKSNFKKGVRPKFHEPFSNQTYWVGGEWRGQLKPALYALVVFSPDENKGTFSVGLNEKEAWTPDLYKYVAEVLPKINQGLCDLKGFSGQLKF